MEDSVIKLYVDLLNHGYSENQAQLFLGRCTRVVGKLITDAVKEELKYGTVDNETVGD